MKQMLKVLPVLFLLLWSCTKKDIILPDVAEIATFSVTVGEGSEKQIITAQILGDQITFTVPAVEPSTILTPFISTNQGAVVTPMSGQSLDFQTPQTYTVKKGKTTKQYTVLATFEIKPAVQNVYKFYFLDVTKDALFAAYDIFNDKTSEIYISDARTVFDKAFLPSNVKHYDNLSYKSISYKDSPAYYQMKGIAQRDPNAHFTLYTSSSIWYQFFLDNWFDATRNTGTFGKEIGWDKFHFVYLEDGRGNYPSIYEITQEEMDSHIAVFGPLRDAMGYRDLTDQEVVTIRNNTLAAHAILVGPMGGRSESWMSCPEVVNHMKHTTFAPDYFMPLVKKDPFQQFSLLTKDQQDQFVRMMKLDVKLFNSNNTKPNFIITGANFSSINSLNAQMTMVKALCADFGATYNMFFKGHPANAAFEGMLTTEIAAGNIAITSLPASTPAEIIIAAGYADMLAGMFSSLYFGVEEQKIHKLYIAGGYDAMDEYIRNMLIPAGGYPGRGKWGDFNSFQ